MLKYIEETGKHVEITGFRNVNIMEAKEFVEAIRRELPKSAGIQFFDAKLVATWQHLYFAVLNALLAFKNDRNISKSVVMETILYASAQRQIRKAICLMGVKRGIGDIAVVIIGESTKSIASFLSAVSKYVGKETDDSVIEISQEKMDTIREAFGITDAEVEAIIEKDNVKEALVDLIIERVALLSTQL
jgi:tRNA threonylcarbamoyladenosine modification (KEOPS) complex Cgi121 subunit